MDEHDFGDCTSESWKRSKMGRIKILFQIDEESLEKIEGFDRKDASFSSSSDRLGRPWNEGSPRSAQRKGLLCCGYEDGIRPARKAGAGFASRAIGQGAPNEGRAAVGSIGTGVGRGLVDIANGLAMAVKISMVLTNFKLSTTWISLRIITF